MKPEIFQINNDFIIGTVDREDSEWVYIQYPFQIYIQPDGNDSVNVLVLPWMDFDIFPKSSVKPFAKSSISFRTAEITSKITNLYDSNKQKYTSSIILPDKKQVLLLD